MNAPARRVGSALPTLASLALTLLALVGIARLGLGRGATGKADTTDMEYDPLLGWRKGPGALAHYREREFTTEVRVDSHSLRDTERSYTASRASSAFPSWVTRSLRVMPSRRKRPRPKSSSPPQ
jgi:hypothetical protein